MRLCFAKKSLMLTLFIALVSCGTNSSLQQSETHSTSAAVLGGPMVLSTSEKAVIDYCRRTKINAQELALEAAQVVCYGGSPEEARLRASSSLSCDVFECPFLIDYKQSSVKVEINLSSVLWQFSSKASGFYPQDFANSDFGVMLSFGIVPSTTKKVPTCQSYQTLPTWSAHVQAVENELNATCAKWIKFFDQKGEIK